jgi:hypothetical protein
VARALGAGGQGARGGSAAAGLPVVLGLGALLLAAGIIPASSELAVLQPGWVVAGVGLLGIAIGLCGARLPAISGHAVIGIGLAAALHLLVATTGLYPAYNDAAVAARLAAAKAGGLAVAGMTYNAEFNFAAHLDAKVATPVDGAAIRAWCADHPDGLLFGPVGRVPVAAAPADHLLYRGLDYGFWPASRINAPG